jgi:hypothetical protein
MSTYQSEEPSMVRLPSRKAALVPVHSYTIRVLRTALDNQGLWELEETAMT